MSSETRAIRSRPQAVTLRSAGSASGIAGSVPGTGDVESRSYRSLDVSSCTVLVRTGRIIAPLQCARQPPSG